MDILRDLIFNTGLGIDILGILILALIALVGMEQEAEQREKTRDGKEQ